ncbi:fungal-specific transcription factor domain-containing protein [Lipomyces orientalis]|uniref:Fungal-specific transcription factor domain-containing protein n=1 Tax=Lipomyces orientalis TaxID=1233043 RepID=A0ACC3TNP0_9ASCO
MSSSGSPHNFTPASAHGQAQAQAAVADTFDASLSEVDFLPGDSDLKRRRIARACDCCRKKKIKCDGKMPSCTNCINYKTVCVFTFTEKKRNPPKGAKYIESLESRLDKMEDLIRTFVPEYQRESFDDHDDIENSVAERIRSAVQNSAPARSQSNTSSPSNATHGNHADSHVTPADDEDRAGTSVTTEPEPDPARTDESTSFLITTRDGDSKFIGQSSTFSIFSPLGLQWISEKSGDNSFSKQLQEINELEYDMARFGVLDQNMVVNSPGAMPIPMPHGTTATKSYTTLPLPNIETATNCIEIYASIFYPILPVFTIEEMRRIMNSVYSDKRFRIVDYCAMCAILAVGLRAQSIDFASFRTAAVDDPLPATVCSGHSVQENVEQSWGYFMNAMSYFTELVCGASSITAVQTLITLGIYLEGSDSAEVAYMINSNAARIAQCIGLHSKASSYGLSAEEAHRRQRIFWTCYITDKDFSLRTGRPPIIYDQDVSTDVPADINSSAPNMFSIMIRFAQIQSRTYTRLYSAAASRVSETELIDTIGELDKELLEWRDSMPLEYRPDHEIIERNPRVLVHLVYMHFAYYNCLSAIHRMSMHYPTWRGSRRAAVTPSSAPRNPRVFASAALCVQAARSTIYLVKYFDNAETSCGWLAVYYILCSLVTLFANCLQNPLQPSSRSDLALMNTVVRFVRLVSEGGHYSPKGERAMQLVKDMVRLATQVVEKSEKEQAKLKRPAPDLTPQSSATTSDSTTTNSNAALSTGPGPNIENAFTKPSVVQAQTYPTEQSSTQFLFAGQQGTDSMGGYPTFGSASNILSPSPPGPTQSSYLGRQTLFEPSMNTGSTATPSPMAATQSFAASSSGSASATRPNPINEDSPFNATALSDPAVLEQMMNFEQPFIPRDIWNLPAVFSWDWGSGTTAATLGTGSMPSDADVPDDTINVAAVPKNLER